jgi:nucleoside-diphosphate-sugar epimerase
MRVVVIGGSGHIGTYLVPRLVGAGHEVVVVSRGEREPYRPHGAWRSVSRVSLDRTAREAAGDFGARIAELSGDVVIDLICFDADSARQLVEALRGRVQHFLHCGSIWVHGPSADLPTTEDRPRAPICDYGRGKAAIESYLLGQARLNGFPATLIHPGHITGPGWVPINPAGNLDVGVFQALADGTEVRLPNMGMETLQHVHADDVAQAFTAAMAHRSVAVGESFHNVADGALTLRGYAEAVAGWFGRRARLSFHPYEQWRASVGDDDARATLDHIAHSPYCSIDKARGLLGYRPRYTPLQAIEEAVDRLVADGRITR